MFVVGGESLIDLVSEPLGPDGIVHMTAHQGGSPYNCAIALSKLNNDTGYLCPISADGFGGYLLEPLEQAGVKVLLGERVRAPSTLAVVTLNAKREARYEFYRGADRAFSKDGLLAALPQDLKLFQIGGFCPIEPVDAAVWLAVAEEASRRGALISMDPNVRPSLVDDFDSYRDRLDSFFDLVQLMKVSVEDLKSLDASKSIEQHVEALLSRPKCELVVVTFGEDGSRAFTRAGSAQAGVYSPPVFGDTVGAGDTLMAGVLTALAERDDLVPGSLKALGTDELAEVLRFGAIAAGLNCAHKGCVPPTRDEVDAVLNESD